MTALAFLKIDPVFWEYFFLAMLGSLLHLLSKVYEQIKKEEPFTLKNRTLYTIGTIMSVIMSFVIIYSREDIASVYPITTLIAVMTGYSSQSVFNKLLSTKSPFNKNEPEQ